LLKSENFLKKFQKKILEVYFHELTVSFYLSSVFDSKKTESKHISLFRKVREK